MIQSFPLAHPALFVYLNQGCSGLGGQRPKHCPVLHSPSPGLHAARRNGTQAEDDRMDGRSVGCLDGCMDEASSVIKKRRGGRGRKALVELETMLSRIMEAGGL